ncbi:MAG: hypothetical protein HY075_01095 [Deltaproteobacteria bacterium]|nr:hypothetical protein [Deltaproteobacteria bacterium]
MKKSVFIFLILGATLAFTGCGKDRSGTYKGNETVQQSGMAAQSSGISLNVTSGKDANMSGTYANTQVSAQFSGKVNDNGDRIENVSINMPQTASGATVNGIPSTGCGGVYTGTLTIQDDAISGNLTLTQPAANQAVVPTNNFGGTTTSGATTTQVNPCQGAIRSITLQKQ